MDFGLNNTVALPGEGRGGHKQYRMLFRMRKNKKLTKKHF